MGRVRSLPTETVIAITFVVAAALVSLVVLFSSGESRDELAALAGSSDTSALDEAEPAPPPEDAPDAPDTDEPAAPPAGPNAPAPTISVPPPTVAPGSPGEPTNPAPSTTAEPIDECAQLSSLTRWSATSGAPLLVAAAGTSAEYVEVVTNESDVPCTLYTNRCGSTAQLLTAEGEGTDAPRRACTTEFTEVVLEPGEPRTERLTVSFPVPPGEYLVRITRYDGTTVDLSARLDDRLAACAAEPLSLRVNGQEQFRDVETVNTAGFALGLVVTGATDCTVRVTESRLALTAGAVGDGTTDDGDELVLVDDTPRWSADLLQTGILTHLVAPPAELPAGEYDGVVTLVLADGGELTAPVLLEIG